MNRNNIMSVALNLFLLCTGVAQAQYNQVNDIRNTESGDAYDHGAMPKPVIKAQRKADVADFHIYDYAVSDQEMKQLQRW